ncbi:MAG TPA: GTPase HflX [Sphaerochaeta sp.]|nr:GTPase HflX [Sphaerochaeta sp.]
MPKGAFSITDTTLIQIEQLQTKAFVVVIRPQGEEIRRSEARLEELQSLVQTMGAEIVSSLVIPLRETNAATLIGSGKVAELDALAKEAGADCIIFDRDLPPRVQRNLEQTMDIAVIDRQEVILQIFSDRAATKEAVLQVALARQEYSLPRLTRKWTHLSRQRGGTKGTRGEGETQLEIDRRIVLNKITVLKDELKKVEAQRAIQRKSRSNGTLPTAAIVGYTNAGKSSLLNLLSKSDVLVENKLFATLDPTTRKVALPRGGDMLISDTVGFVSDLPHQLVDAFKSTLEEARYDDFIIHVVDAAHPDMLQCFETTMKVLSSLGCEGKPMVVFINKMDSPHNEFSVAKILADHPGSIAGSVREQRGITELLNAMEIMAHHSHPESTYLFPHSRGDLVALVRNNGTIIDIKYIDDGVAVTARIPARLLSKLEPFSQTED